MAITSQELLDGFNNAGIDTAAKLDTYLSRATAVTSAFVAGGFATEAEATEGLTYLKLQRDVVAAQKAMNAIQAQYQADHAQYLLDKELAATALLNARQAIKEFAATAPDLSDPAVQLQFNQLELAEDMAEGDGDQVEADWQTVEDQYATDSSNQAAAIETAEQALEDYLNGV